MKALIHLGVLALAMLTVAPGQSPAPPPNGNAATKGACSPIFSNNMGPVTITCKGFTEQQSKKIVALLQQLADRQSSDQDTLLSKMEELIATVKATQRLNTPRIISQELREQIEQSPWERAPRNVY